MKAVTFCPSTWKLRPREVNHLSGLPLLNHILKGTLAATGERMERLRRWCDKPPPPPNVSITALFYLLHKILGRNSKIFEKKDHWRALCFKQKSPYVDFEMNATLRAILAVEPLIQKESKESEAGAFCSASPSYSHFRLHSSLELLQRDDKTIMIFTK